MLVRTKQQQLLPVGTKVHFSFCIHIYRDFPGVTTVFVKKENMFHLNMGRKESKDSPVVQSRC